MATLGIEASNIGSGGGITHLREILNNANPIDHGFSKVILWASDKLLSQIQDQPWLEKRAHPYLNRSIFHRTIWQKFVFPKEAKASCDILFLPAGNIIDFQPYVSICQNLLPFDSEERARYGLSLMRLRLKVLQWIQTKCYNNAKGMIFLSNHSLNMVQKLIPRISSKSVIIPHAADAMLFKPRILVADPVEITKILYVSTIDVYKHQWNVGQAVLELVKEGHQLELTLVGGTYAAAYKRLMKTLQQHPNWQDHVKIRTNVSFAELPAIYAQADIFVLASTCETFGIILLEAMSSGLPILCADNPSLRETLLQHGIYFNALDYKDLKEKLLSLNADKPLQKELAIRALARSESYSWQQSSKATFDFIFKTLQS